MATSRDHMNIRDQLDPELAEYIELVLNVCSSRAAYVINHILEHGSISSEDIRNEGYVHGARAVGDVRDNGIPLVTKSTKSTDNRTIAEYFLGSAKDIKRHKFGGRIAFPASLKQQLIDRDGLICQVSKQELPESELQIDHRIPYYLSGDIKGERDPADFMLLSRSMQRAKSWDCEHCPNLFHHFQIDNCRSCYWAYPDAYTHAAMKEVRRLSITWQGDEVASFDTMKEVCQQQMVTPQSFVKGMIRKAFPGSS